MKDCFQANIRFRVGSGKKIFFFGQNWIGERPLAEMFLNLFNCARDRKANVASYLDKVGNQVQWGPILQRNLTEEENQFMALLDILS